MLRDSGALTHGEFSVLDRYFKMMTDTTWTGLEVDLIVYIKSDPEILLNRIERRGREVSTFHMTIVKITKIF